VTTRPRWARTSNSANNFDLALVDAQALDSKRICELLDRIQEEKHRGLSLSGRADSEFRRWLKHPDTALKSDAYVLLSNWFCTQSGDRRSMVASRCEDLWDELFPCRPARRLSSPEPGRNHVMVPQEFESFWKQILKAQGAQPNPSGTQSTPDGENGRPLQLPNQVTIGLVEKPAEPSDAPEPDRRPGLPLTIAEAKSGLALTFGVSPENIEITIRG